MPAIRDIASSEAVGHDEVDSMFESFQLTNQEYLELDSKFGQLVNFQAWQLLKKNAKNNHTDEFDDVAQEMRMALVRSAVYTKRQNYIQRCFIAAAKHTKDPFTKKVLGELEDLWAKRKRHGANRRKFGLHQERILDHIVNRFVPDTERPDKSACLSIDTQFITYCKSVTWNALKTMGKRITREKSWRTGLASLSEYEYLGSDT
jgi:hypothetical protein